SQRYVHKGAPARVAPFSFLMMNRLTPGSRFVRAVAAASVAVCAGAACQSGVTTGPKLATNQVLRVMLEDQPASLDPGQTQYTYETAVLRAVSEPLLRPTPDLGRDVAAAAQSSEVTGAGTASVFHLRARGKY